MHLVTLESFERIIPSNLVDNLAIKHNVDKCNQIRLPGMAVFACLLEATLTGRDATQRALEEVYLRQTGKTADHSSFGKRLAKIPVGFFRGIFEHIYSQLAPEATAGEKMALRIKFIDATIVTLSAQLIKFGLLAGTKSVSPHRAVKAVFSLEYDGIPRFVRLCATQEEHNDNIAIGQSIQTILCPNDLCVFDAGMNDRSRMIGIHNANAYFLTRHSSQKLNVCRVVWEAAPDTITQDAPEKNQETYQLVRVEDCRFGNSLDKAKFEDFPLVAVHGLRWDTRSKKWNPLVIITNLPLAENDSKAGPFSFTELAELYRKRWDIEIFFKFIKQHLGYRHILSRTQNGLEVMIYMTLIAALLMIWYKRVTQIKNGWPAVKYWIAINSVQWTQALMEEAIWIQVSARKNRPLRI